MAFIGTTQLTRNLNNTMDTFLLGSWQNDYSSFRDTYLPETVPQTFLDTTLFTTETNVNLAQQQFETNGTFVDYYLKINSEVMRILVHDDQTGFSTNIFTYLPLMRIKVERGFGGSPVTNHSVDSFVQIHNSLDSIEFEETEDIPAGDTVVPYDVIEYTLDDGFVSESVSPGFGVDGVTIEQTIIKPFDPFSGLNVQTSSFLNTNQGLQDSNQDGRIELGMFTFDEENLAADNFPSILSSPFLPITKENLVKNGDCKFIERSYIEEVNDEGNDIPIVVKPEGEWRFLSLRDITDDDLLQFYDFPDFQGFQGYGGRYSYVPMSLEQSGSAGMDYWSGVDFQTSGSFSGFKEYFQGVNQIDIENYDNIPTLRDQFRLRYEDSQGGNAVPTIATWLITNEAYSNQRCLCFQNYYIWNNTKVFDFLRNVDVDGFRKWPFNYLIKSQFQNDGEIIDDSYSANDVITDNQYRVLNQVQKIYDKFNDTPINPYSSLKIRFKMKTTSVFPPDNSNSDFNFSNPLDENLGFAPTVEVGILSTQFEETPKAGTFSIPSNLGEDCKFRAPGSFNSTRYFNGANFEQKKQADLGGMTRFQNKKINQWETFEFDFNLKNDHNNRGLIYGVPYGGRFDDADNNGPVEIMLNHIAKGGGQDTEDAGVPKENAGEIYFKVPGYQDKDTAQINFTLISPHQTTTLLTSDGYVEIQKRVTVKHGDFGTDDYMSVASKLGDTAGSGVNTSTGVQNDGTVLEAYLMYVGCNNYSSHTDTHFLLPMSTNSDVDYTYPDVVVAYWNGERWTYDNNAGYDRFRTFAPINTHCFIIGRLYRSPISTEDGINGIDQYVSNASQFPTDGLGNMFLFLQAGNNFQGRVLIDNIECFESHKFKLDCDVRKKISVGNYGIADLTKYYDKELQPNEYKDSTAPLEVQFYFYPQYPTNEFFNIERTPIYQDFRLGRFYIYDINWGDGSANEFTSTPEKIDENTALYHTYENHGIFEITGTALRIKTDEEGNILGVVHNQKFKLRININEGLDEDFLYFGSDGYSFLPFKNTTPIIGGISEQSSYYKTIKRQLGFLDNEKISIEYKNKSDKLKTELALLKMENQNQANLEVLPSYMIPRYLTEYNLGNNETKTWPGPDLAISSETMPDEIIRIDRSDGVAAALNQNQDWGGNLLDDGLETGKEYTFQLNVDSMVWDLLPPLALIYKGISPIREELGKGIGDCDLTSIKYYNTPKSIWEMFGFENDDLEQIGNPDNKRYWKNIIPNDYSIFRREGLPFQLIQSGLPFPKFKEEFDLNGDGNYTAFDKDMWDNWGRPDIRKLINDLGNGNQLDTENYTYPDYALEWNSLSDIPTGNGLEQPSENFRLLWTDYTTPPNIDTFSEQNFLKDEETAYVTVNDYYYPVLPKHGADGRFVEIKTNTDGDIVSGYPRINNVFKIPFPLQGDITNEMEQNENLLFNIINQKIDVEVFDDNSGNKNYGISIGDFKSKFEKQTLRVQKSKIKNIFKTSRVNGAF